MRCLEIVDSRGRHEDTFHSIKQDPDINQLHLNRRVVRGRTSKHENWYLSSDNPFCLKRFLGD